MLAVSRRIGAMMTKLTKTYSTTAVITATIRESRKMLRE